MVSNLDTVEGGPPMKRILKTAGDMLPTGLLVLGAVAVSCGIGLIFLPAGVIAAGVLMITGGVLLIRGGGDDSEQQT